MHRRNPSKDSVYHKRSSILEVNRGLLYSQRREFNLKMASASISNNVGAAVGSSGTYLPQQKVNTMDLLHYFFPLFYASEKGVMGIWDKELGLGHIKRRVEQDGRSKFHVLEMVNGRTNSNTYIYAPRMPHLALHIVLPHMVLVVKSYRRNFSFEVQILDTRGFSRRLQFATWFNPNNLRKLPYLTQLPLKLEIGWNEIHLDLRDICKTLFNTTFAETTRIVVNANCRLRQIFFCGDAVINGDLPVPSMRIFENMRAVTTDFGPLNHPDYTETGPFRSRDVIFYNHPIPEPPIVPTQSRIEKDLIKIHHNRFNELDRFSKWGEPYRTYFRHFIAQQAIEPPNQNQNSPPVKSDGNLMNLISSLTKGNDPNPNVIINDINSGSNWKGISISPSKYEELIQDEDEKVNNRAPIATTTTTTITPTGGIVTKFNPHVPPKVMTIPKGLKGAITLMKLMRNQSYTSTSTKF